MRVASLFGRQQFVERYRWLVAIIARRCPSARFSFSALVFFISVFSLFSGAGAERSFNRNFQLAGAAGYDSCFEECMRDCNFATCRDECRHQCEGVGSGHGHGASCQAGYQLCFGTGGHRTCCPVSKRCCLYYERPSLREKLVCCNSDQGCCFSGGCYNPATQQCGSSGIINCPANHTMCFGNCCPPGQVCTAQGCAAADQACQGQRCSQGEVCTPQGCCARNRVADGKCCPRDRTICDGKCCESGESCQTTEFGGFCLRPLPPP